MATPIKPTTDTTETYNEPTIDGVADESDEWALRSALEQIDPDDARVRISVYQIPPGGKKDVFLYPTTVQDFARDGIEEIQRSYGAGDYRVRIFGPSGLLTHRRISIGPPKDFRPDVPKPDVAPHTLETILAGQAQTMMLGFQELGKMITASRPASQIGASEIIGLIGALAPLMQRPREADPLEMVTKLLALQKEIAPPPVSSDGTIDGGAVVLEAIKTFGKPLGEMMANQVRNSPRPQPSPRPDALATPVPAQNPLDETDTDMRFAMLRSTLLMTARNDAPTDAYAAMVFDVLDESEIARYVTGDTWYEELGRFIPELIADPATYRPWFERLRNDIIADINGDTNAHGAPE